MTNGLGWCAAKRRPSLAERSIPTDSGTGRRGCRELGRLAPPILDAFDYLDIRTRRLRCSIQHVLAEHMHRRRSSYWAWSEETWHAIVGTSREDFEAIADGPKSRAALVAVAMLLQRPIAVARLGRFDRVALAYRIFGRHEVDPALARVHQALAAWGYTCSRSRSTRQALRLRSRSIASSARRLAHGSSNVPHNRRA